MRVGLVQLCASDDPVQNSHEAARHVEAAADRDADFILTPEVTNCLSASRPPHEDDRLVNRSLVVSPKGNVVARYDKLHMFDVTLSATETYRESSGYRPGSSATLAEVEGAKIGMTICYDLRFPYLYRDLAQAGAQILTVPSAFAPETGAAHWDVLLRARAIETGAFVLAPAQCGTHHATHGRARKTYGHSLVVDPWGRVLGDGGTGIGVTLVDIDLEAVDDARRRIPSLTHDRSYRIQP